MRQDKTVARILLIFFIANVVLAAPVLVRQRRLVTDRTNDEPIGEPEQDPAGPVHPATLRPPAGPETWSISLDELLAKSPENSAPNSRSGLHQGSRTNDEPMGEPVQDSAGPVHPATPPPPAWLDTSLYKGKISEKYSAPDSPSGLLQMSHLPKEYSAPDSPSGLLQMSHLPPPQPSELKHSWLTDPSQDRWNQYDWRLHSPPNTLTAWGSSHKMLPPPQPSKLDNSWSQNPSQDRPNQNEGSLHSVWRPPAPPAPLEAGDSSHKMLPPPQPSKLKNSWSQDPSQDRPNQYDGSLRGVSRPPAPPATLETESSSHKMLPPPRPSKLKNSWSQDPPRYRPYQYDGSLRGVSRPPAPPATLETESSSHKMLPPPRPSKLKNSWSQDPPRYRPYQYDGSLRGVSRPPAPPATLETESSSHKMLPPPQPSILESSWSQDPSQYRPNQYDGSLRGVWRPPAPPATLEAGSSSHKMLPPPQPSKLENSWSQDPSQDRPNQYEESTHSAWRPSAPPATLEAGDSSHEMLPPGPPPQPWEIKHWSLIKPGPSEDWRWNQYQWWLHSPPIKVTAWDSSRELSPPALEDRPSQVDSPVLEDRPSQIDPPASEDRPSQIHSATVHPINDAWHQLMSFNFKDMYQASTPSWPSDDSGWEEDAAKVADETHLHP